MSCQIYFRHGLSDCSVSALKGIFADRRPQWPGQHIDAIKGCYASLWTPRAVAYRRKKNINDLELLPAVVVMEMVDAQASGVAFSCDPQSDRRDVLVINANFGLGESVVSGAFEPDTYCLTPNVFKAVPEIKSKQLGAKQGLTRNRAGGEVYLEICGDRSNEQALNDENIKNLGILITVSLRLDGDEGRIYLS
ncbi:MAG TPA: PEP/pyruvate-binding domain-containing protein [Syntrophomonadaceae bacterium]|nr:PEP/pyruvate-binding domain-containing protein [Syntrophomonadaceae bacterium]